MRRLINLVEGNTKTKSNSNLLLELDWYEKSPLTKVLQRHRGEWIHFSNGAPNRGNDPDFNKLEPLPDKTKYAFGGYSHTKELKRYNKDVARVTRRNAIHRVPKIGVNPKPAHRDPLGIYFYPVDFVLNGNDRTRSGDQYGLDRKYYYICHIDLTDPNGITLQTMTWDDVDELAARNGGVALLWSAVL